MAWNSLAPNQLVTMSDMSESAIPLKSGKSHTLTNACVTKSYLITNYQVKESLLTAYTDNRYVMFSDIKSNASMWILYNGVSKGSSSAEIYAYRAYGGAPSGSTIMATVKQSNDNGSSWSSSTMPVDVNAWSFASLISINWRLSTGTHLKLESIEDGTVSNTIIIGDVTRGYILNDTVNDISATQLLVWLNGVAIVSDKIPTLKPNERYYLDVKGFALNKTYLLEIPYPSGISTYNIAYIEGYKITSTMPYFYNDGVSIKASIFSGGCQFLGLIISAD